MIAGSLMRLLRAAVNCLRQKFTIEICTGSEISDRWYSCPMRATAILLALSLMAPAVGAALCELTCSERHRDAAAAQTDDCHKQHADTGATIVTGTDVPCRHDVGGLTSVAAASSTCTPGTNSIAIMRAVTLDDARAADVLIVRRPPIRPPDPPTLASSLLRI